MAVEGTIVNEFDEVARLVVDVVGSDGDSEGESEDEGEDESED